MKLILKITKQAAILAPENVSESSIVTSPSLATMLIPNKMCSKIISPISCVGIIWGIKVFVDNYTCRNFVKSVKCSVIYVQTPRKFYNRRLERWKF